MKNFLMSPRGGAWRADEIIILNNPNWAEAQKATTQSIADYQMVYFSGHGFSTNKSRLVNFADAPVPDYFLANQSKKQLIIVDACRVFSPPGISGIPEAFEPYDSFTGISEARIKMDMHIANSPDGCLIIHATKSGTYAYDDEMELGGAFTIALIRMAMNIRSQREFTPITMKQLLPFVTNYLEDNGNDQKPCIAYKTGELTVPFALDVPQVISKQRGAKRHAEYSPESGIAVLAIFGIALFGLGKLLSNN